MPPLAPQRRRRGGPMAGPRISSASRGPRRRVDRNCFPCEIGDRHLAGRNVSESRAWEDGIAVVTADDLGQGAAAR